MTDDNKGSKNRLFMIFNHYSLEEKSLDELIIGNKLQSELKKIERDIDYLYTLLEPKAGYKGFAYIFIEPGWPEALKFSQDETGNRNDWGRLLNRLGTLQGRLDSLLARKRYGDRIRFVTAHLFYDLLENLNKSTLGKNCYRFLAGEGKGLYYDGPKLIEAAIRIANIGRNIPTFRFDDDVIYYGHRYTEDRKKNYKYKEVIAIKTMKNIRCLCRKYDELSNNSVVSCFLFTGHYGGNKNTKGFDKIVDCFPSRILQLANIDWKCDERTLPFTLESRYRNALNEEIIPSQLQSNFKETGYKLSQDSIVLVRKKNIEWIIYDRVNQKTYSVKQKKGEDKLQVFHDRNITIPLDHSPNGSTKHCKEFLNRLIKLGANPYNQVISGAGLCLCDSAILDLPPYSNMRQNVLWIDDHLKYALHHELRHFGYDRETSRIGRISSAKFKQMRFRKRDKKPNFDDVKWHVQKYIMRLILGCVVDSWLRADDVLKDADLEWYSYKKEVERLKKDKKLPGYYTQRFQDVLLGGWGEEDKIKIKNELWRIAKERLDKFITEFTDKSDSLFKWTFFDLYIMGYDSYPHLGETGILPDHMQFGLKQVVSNLPNNKAFPDEDTKLPDREEEKTLEQALTVLIEDFVNYIDLVILWRYFVQYIRFLLNWSETRPNVLWMFPGERGLV